MRRPLLLLVVNAAICLIVLMMLMQSVAVLQLLAVADVVNGTVEVHSGATKPFHLLHQGEMIRTGDTIRAGANGTAEFRWIDGTRLRLEPNTEITVRHCSLNLKRHSQNSDFQLARGKVFVRIPQKLSANSRFSIETPSATTNVRGTIFSVAANTKDTEVAVWKGLVEVANPKSAQIQAVPAGALLSASDSSWQLFRSDSRLAQDATHAFEPLASIVAPSLQAHLTLRESVRQFPSFSQRFGTLVGRAEAGDRVLVDGKELRVRGDGSFLRAVTVKSGANNFEVVAIDRHGATRSQRVRFFLSPLAANSSLSPSPVSPPGFANNVLQ